MDASDRPNVTEWPGRGRGAKIAVMAQLSESVSLDTTDSSVAVLTVDNPPVNALSWHVRQGVFDGLNQALADGASANPTLTLNDFAVLVEGRTAS